MEPIDERREALVEAVAREIRLRGPDRARRSTSSRRAGRTGRSARPRCCSSTRCCGELFGGETPSATELLRDDIGIEALIDRLEELDESDSWDA